MHNYRFYCETVRDARHEICLTEQHKQHKITHTRVWRLACFSHPTDFSWIFCSQLNITLREMWRMCKDSHICETDFSCSIFVLFCSRGGNFAKHKVIFSLRSGWYHLKANPWKKSTNSEIYVGSSHARIIFSWDNHEICLLLFCESSVVGPWFVILALFMKQFFHILCFITNLSTERFFDEEQNGIRPSFFVLHIVKGILLILWCNS